MPTQRPFLGNFLAVFRAHSSTIPKASPSISSSAAVAASATIWTSTPTQHLAKAASASASESTTTPSKPINQKANPYTSNPASSTSQPDRQLLQHNVSPQTHLPRSPPSPGLPVYGPPNQPTYPSVQDVRPSRRGSDSSSDSGGFRESNRGGDKWFIGGRTAGGEERYYKLSMVKRDRSLDRISMDQLSL